MDKRDAASRRKAAASIVTAAAHGEENSIQLLRALELLDEPESAKYFIFSDIYVPVFENLEEYLNQPNVFRSALQTNLASGRYKNQNWRYSFSSNLWSTTE